jgi:hypothetical protein
MALRPRRDAHENGPAYSTPARLKVLLLQNDSNQSNGSEYRRQPRNATERIRRGTCETQGFHLQICLAEPIRTHFAHFSVRALRSAAALAGKEFIETVTIRINGKWFRRIVRELGVLASNGRIVRAVITVAATRTVVVR